MGLPELRGRKWHVQGAISTQGEGLYEGLDWLSNTLKAMQVGGRHEWPGHFGGGWGRRCGTCTLCARSVAANQRLPWSAVIKISPSFSFPGVQR